MDDQNPQEKLADQQRQFLDDCRGRRFVRRSFASYPALRTIGTAASDESASYHASVGYYGQEFDPAQFEIVENGWDHEHCHVCNVHILPGNDYWQCVEQSPAGQRLSWELCFNCHELLTREGT
jgi:hypothetical protein